MASGGTLYAAGNQTPALPIRAAAAWAGVPITEAEGYVHFETNKKSEFLSKFPHGKVPAWDGKDGFKLFEGLAIARYLASLSPDSGLLGKSKEDAALIEQWIHLAELEADVNTTNIAYLINGQLGAYNKPAHNVFLERHTRALTTLEKHISTRTFFVGERITLADLVIASILQRASRVTLDPALRAKFPSLLRHLDTITHQPKLAGVYPDTVVLDKAPQYEPPKKEAKEPKEPKPAAPKAEKKEKPKKKDEDEDDGDDNGIPEEPKAKNPLDDLPKSSFNLEDWKRAYSNKDTRGKDGALEWFYENFDKEGFSTWRVDFKYPEDLTQTFMSNNQIGGFFNRLEASRKYLFASVGVLGTPNASVISGALILRGQEAEPVVNVAPDWESYKFTRLDLSKDDEKAFFEAALAWDLEVDGKKWVDGKNFK